MAQVYPSPLYSRVADAGVGLILITTCGREPLTVFSRRNSEPGLEMMTERRDRAESDLLGNIFDREAGCLQQAARLFYTH